MTNPEIILKPGKERSAERFHPWIFSGAIQQILGDPADGDLVTVLTSSKKIIGRGHYQRGSITVRMISFGDEIIDQEFWNRKLNDAWNHRKDLGLINNPNTNAFRLIHGEGDGLPGLIADYYNGIVVLQCHSHGMLAAREYISNAVINIPESDIIAVYDKSAAILGEEKAGPNAYIFGSHAGETEILENENKFLVNWETGQKTGFFLDQRDNRKLLGEYSAGKKILNTFCYSGGFSVYALHNNAKEVHSLDSSKKAIELTEKNIALNNFSGNHKTIVADAIPYLRNIEKDYDIIILDPPAFAKHLSAKHKAIQAYKRLNEEAIRQIKSGGMIFTFSCSQVVDMESFTGAVFAASLATGRNVRIIHRLHQPADHPVSIYHPEGEYLKGLVISVD